MQRLGQPNTFLALTHFLLQLFNVACPDAATTGSCSVPVQDVCQVAGCSFGCLEGDADVGFTCDDHSSEADAAEWDDVSNAKGAVLNYCGDRTSCSSTGELLSDEPAAAATEATCTGVWTTSERDAIIAGGPVNGRVTTKDVYVNFAAAGPVHVQVRKTPSWPRSWANCSLS